MANVLVNLKIEAHGVVNLSDNYGGDSGMEEHFTTYVACKDNITWMVTTDLGGKCVELLKVTKQEGTPDVFLDAPRVNANGTITGVIGTAPEGTEESYSIFYTVDGEIRSIEPHIEIITRK